MKRDAPNLQRSSDIIASTIRIEVILSNGIAIENLVRWSIYDQHIFISCFDLK